MKKIWVLLTALTTLLSLGIGWIVGAKYGIPAWSSGTVLSPFVEKSKPQELPLQKYSIVNLQNYPYQASRLTIESEIAIDPGFTSYVFSYRTLGKKMTGQINIPTGQTPINGYPVIMMVRGWAPAETYSTGVGTKPAAAVFARHGYITIAPDFFGYAGSEPDSDDTWESRFIKPMNVIELLKTIEAQKTLTVDNQKVNLDTTRIGLWAHSNGGQIALTTLEILERPIPTTLWAPVSAPFPYSLLYFTDEDADEGKNFRKVLAQFETEYNTFDFSFTQHLDKLTGVIQIHQGTADEAIPPTWSQEFVAKVKKENDRRQAILDDRAKETTPSAQTMEKILPPVDISLLMYPGSDHNLRPAWDIVVQRDLTFFAKQLP